jgi:hypothetical protein
MMPFERYLFPIIPFTNNIRMNYQSPQAIRIFFGRDKVVDNNVVMRPIYGPLSVLKTTGQHPTEAFKVYAFPPELERIRLDLIEEVKGHLGGASLVSAATASEEAPATKGSVGDLDFNFLEIKVYMGRDIFCCDNYDRPIMGEDNVPLRVDCNKSVGLHNDLNFSDEGIQDPHDTASGEHPIVTVTVGSERDLTFVRMTKPRRSKQQQRWKVCSPNSRAVYTLEDGSIFVLLPTDEIPAGLRGKGLYKTKHKATFGGTGISFGLVFRSVKSFSYFDRTTDKWLWKLDNRYKCQVDRYLTKADNLFREISSATRKEERRDEIDGICKNVQQFLRNLI